MVAFGTRDSPLLALVVVVGLVTFLYSVLVAGQVLIWFVLVVQAGLLYLAWRFVRAVERIADALSERT